MQILWAVTAVFGTVYLFLEPRPVSVFRSLSKVLSILPLAALAALGGQLGLCIALCLCAVGDLALSRSGDRWFLAGMLAFAAGHVTYVVVFGQAFDTPALPDTALALAIAALGLVVWKFLGFIVPRAGALSGPVSVYALVIFAMVVAASVLPDAHLLAFGGAVLFAASDMVIATQKFSAPSLGRLRPAAGPFIWISYVLAQVLILSAFLFPFQPAAT